MLNKIDHKQLGKNDLGWLKTLYHFSFADYVNRDRMQFGPLRVLNDDLIFANSGFDTHPHRDMEIISYVLDGELTHGDSMGNRNTIGRGDVQYMSAGSGIFHSEHNLGDTTARLLQIWIFPQKKGIEPKYGDIRFERKDRLNTWLRIVSGQEGDGPIRICQDANIFVRESDRPEVAEMAFPKGRQGYLVQIEGESEVNGVPLKARDALEIVNEDIRIRSEAGSHILLIDLPAE